MIATNYQIAVVIVTFRRDPELIRLLESIESSIVCPKIVVVVDHAAQSSTEAAIAKFNLHTLYIASPENPGPGGGWSRGMRAALKAEPGTSHFLILDDDVILPVDAIERLADATEKAAISCPMLLDSEKKVWAFPEPSDKLLRRTIREVKSAEECMEKLGNRPLPFVWCTGACILVRRDAVESVGFHRTDFWMLGEDLEYSMRLSAFGGGLFLPDLFVEHLPPEAVNSKIAQESDRLKFGSLLQNLCYLSFHHPNSVHMKSYLPGNARRFFRTFGWNLGSVFRVAQCFWRGAVLGRPAGMGRNSS